MGAIVALISLYSLTAISQPIPARSASPLTAEQVDQLVAPIALYPDPLVAQILMAATYPLEVVEADHWLQIPANAALKRDALTAALQQQPWDPSIKSLVAFPRLLHMMDANLQWTEQLGDAFLAQQADVMDAVQRLRKRAQAAGALASTPQQTVSTEDQEIMIETASSDIVYVPTYNPWCVYGAWPDADYPPFYFGSWAGHVYRRIALLPLTSASTRRSASGRGAISTGVSTKFGLTTIDSNNSTPAMSRPGKSGSTIPPIAMACPIAIQGRQHGSLARPAPRDASPVDSLPRRRLRHRPNLQSLRSDASRRRSVGGVPQRPVPPAFESFGRGAQVRGEAARGFSSRMAPAPSFQAAPMPSFHGGGGAPMPSGGGGFHGGGGRR